MVSCWGVSKHIQLKTKMTHQSNPELLNTVLQLLTEEGAGGFAEGIRLLVNEAMRQERSQALQAQPYERTDTRQGHANGFKPKTLATRVGPIQFQVPQVRGDLDFYPSALEKGIRSEQALKLALAEMYVQGVSTRKVSAIVEQLCGHSVSSTQVSQCAAKLDAELETWRNRPLGCLSLRVHRRPLRKSPPRRPPPGLRRAHRPGHRPRRQTLHPGRQRGPERSRGALAPFLQSLQQRGLHGVLFMVSDDHAGLGAARTAVFPAVPWQRCQFHLQQNAQAYVPRLDQRAAVAQAIRSVFNCPDRPAPNPASRKSSPSMPPPRPNSPPGWRKTSRKASPSSPFPLAHQRRLRTSNALERVNMELKRRTRVAGLFPNEASLLRLVSALLNETSEEWETGKIYLNMENQTQPSVQC